jgi:hypothetical protein
MSDVLKAVENAGMQSDIWYLDVTHITKITFGYVGRLRVILGNADELRYKLNQVVWVVINEGADITEYTEAVINVSDPSRARLSPDSG